MIDISPRRTLTRLGSSSIDVRRRSAPTRVIRASPSSTARPGPIASAPATIVRSLRCRTAAVAADAPLAEDRVPGDSRRMATAASARRARDRERDPGDDDVEARCRGAHRVPSAAPSPRRAVAQVVVQARGDRGVVRT